MDNNINNYNYYYYHYFTINMTPMGVWISLMSAIAGGTGVVNLTKRLERPQPRIEIVIVISFL